MNWLEFWASVIASVASLAWPAAVVAAVWLFRGEIRPLLPRLRLKHKDTEISFRLDEAEKAVGQLPPPSADSPPAPPEELSRFERIADISPRSALLELRREVEDVLRSEDRKFARATGASPPRGVRDILRRMSVTNRISPEAHTLLEDVLAIGNIAAHDSAATFTKEDAMRYRAVVDRAIELLDIDPREMDDF
ncbi:DUF4145 domain-containing protein [Mesorhizobium australicum]|uniref:DUF4145 domain-containing protein n=1 Tax=Mesorhizobium australicum TaxID=536018 RepID=UPI00333C7997